MIEETLLKSNFIGRDGFRWWIGQIPPGESLGAQNKGEGWGNRFKVRILGYHPYSKADLPDEDLPWAGCLLPATSGTGASNLAQSVKYRPGDVVVGFFMDGDNAQIPMIMGAFGRTGQVPQLAASDTAFVPFTGYTSNIPEPNGTLVPDESNEQNSDSQPTPRSLSSEQTEKINSSGNSEKTEIPASKADGQVISPANACDDNFMDEVTSVLENFLGSVPGINGGILGEASDFLNDVNAVAKKIQRLANNPISTMMDSLYRELIPLLQTGLDGLFNATFQKFLGPLGKLPAIGKAIDAVKAMVPPIFDIQEQLGCLPGKIIGGLTDTIKGMLEDALTNIVNFGTCVAEQFAGDLLNKVMDQIIDGMSGVMKGIEPILEFVNVDIREILSSTSDMIASAAGFFDCNQEKGKCTGRVRKWTLGYGADGSFDLQKTFDNVMDQINVQNALSLLNINLPSVPDIGGLTSTLSGLGIDLPSLGVNINDFANNLPGLQSTLSGLGVNLPELGVNINDFAGVVTNSPFTKPNCATPVTCGGPTVKIFGGDGIGGAGRAIFGGIVQNTPNLSDLSSNVVKTASIIGVELTDPGSNYFYKEPLISFSDSCGLGYGAVGKAIVDFETGEIKNIVMISEGENYPVTFGTPPTPEDETEPGDPENPSGPPGPIDTEIPVGIIDIEIEVPGEDVPDDVDIIIDPPTGPTDEPIFDVRIENGRIISVTPINIIQVNTLPTLRVLGGTGAILRPIIGRIPESKPGQKVIQVIDCVYSKNSGLVGYVNGKPYYGPFHEHPLKGVKMVGAVHTNEPHEIIYDTLEESLKKSSSKTTTTSQSSISTPPPSPSPSTSSTPPPSPPPSTPPSSSGGYGGGY